MPQTKTNSAKEATKVAEKRSLHKNNFHTLADFLEYIKLPEYIGNFETNEVTTEMLPEITNDDLNDIGIKKLGHRKIILSGIADYVNCEINTYIREHKLPPKNGILNIPDKKLSKLLRFVNNDKVTYSNHQKFMSPQFI